MSVRFQYAGDKDISVGRAGGASLFSLPGGISFPAAGTILQTLTLQTYPLSEGGAQVINLGNAYSSQTCSVYRKADGSGGDYLDWANVFDVAYFTNGTLIFTNTNQAVSIEVPVSSGNYYTGGTKDVQFTHDGAGSYYENDVNVVYFSNGTDTNIALVGTPQTTEVPSLSYNYFNNGRIDGYTWDGNGGYNYPVTKGNYYASGTDTGLTGLDVPTTVEVPTGSGNYFPTGEIIGYTWDGSGGYNSGVSKGSQYSNGTVIFYTVTSTSNTTEVPAGSGNYFDSYVSSGDLYKWDFTLSPPYTYNGAFYYPSGIYITNYSGTDYYWDGTGGFYP